MKLASILAILGMAAGLVFLIPGSAHANDEAILASCKKDLKLSDSGCACVLNKVHTTLNEKQLAFFVASLRKDRQALMKAQMELTGPR